MELSTRAIGSLPQLCWLARVDRGAGVVRVAHGSAVETGFDYVLEGVWDGKFGEAGFHRSENFFGSGVRIDDDAVWLVPSRALVDRVVVGWHGETLIASNSLALMLAHTGARLDPDHDYREQTRTLLEGVQDYDPTYPVVHPEIESFQQLLHFPVVLEGDSLERVEEAPPLRIASYEQYVELMEGALERIRANSVSPERGRHMRAYTMVSSGYDSPAVSALVRDLDVEAGFTARRSWYNILPLISRGHTVDDGTALAEDLGIQVRYFDKRHRGVSDDEMFLYASCTDGAQVLFLSMAQHIERTDDPAIVFTGFHGDKVWDLHTSGKYLSPEIRRGDISGLDLTEIRLKSGFVNVAVPFMYARRIRDLMEIAKSPAMAPWRIGNDYDRPVARRLIETAGIARGSFATEKRAALEQPHYPFNPDLRRRYLRRLRKRYGFLPSLFYFRGRSKELMARVTWAMSAIRSRVGLPPRPVPSLNQWKGVHLSYELHRWALEALRDRLRASLPPDLRLPDARP